MLSISTRLHHYYITCSTYNITQLCFSIYKMGLYSNAYKCGILQSSFLCLWFSMRTIRNIFRFRLCVRCYCYICSWYVITYTKQINWINKEVLHHSSKWQKNIIDHDIYICMVPLHYSWEFLSRSTYIVHTLRICHINR